jgi:hypothetical protein
MLHAGDIITNYPMAVNFFNHQSHLMMHSNIIGGITDFGDISMDITWHIRNTPNLNRNNPPTNLDNTIFCDVMWVNNLLELLIVYPIGSTRQENQRY